MSGPQFAHIQTWSRKANPAGQCIEKIVAEALRDPGACPHVDSPQPPRVLTGDPATFRADHDAHVAARATIARMKDGSERTRSIRKDRHTMASVVMSYPVPRNAITTDEARAKHAAWEARNLQWLRETYGDQLRVVIAHEDEEHPHLHAWLLPDDPDADATTLHPGKLAKKAAEAEAKAAGASPREAVKLGNRALQTAMTAWQDAYYRAVGAPEGLTRTGPKRRRLTREQWKAEKAAARVTATVAAEAQAEADAITAEATARAADVDRLADGVRSLAAEIEAGTIRRSKDGKIRAANAAALRPALPILGPALLSAVAAREKLDAERRQIDADRAQVDADRQRLTKDRDELDAHRENLESAKDLIWHAVRWVSRHLGIEVPAKLGVALRQIREATSRPLPVPAPAPQPSGMRRMPSVAAQEPVEAPGEPEPEDSGPGF